MPSPLRGNETIIVLGEKSAKRKSGGEKNKYELTFGDERRSLPVRRAAIKQERDRDVKVAKLTEDNDTEAYLTTLECLMKAYDVAKERWAFKLAPQLIGKAQQAYAAMLPDDAKDYDKIKDAILRRYDITEESYRQRFRLLKPKTEETIQELEARLRDLAAKWLKECTTIEAIMD